MLLQLYTYSIDEANKCKSYARTSHIWKFNLPTIQYRPDLRKDGNQRAEWVGDPGDGVPKKCQETKTFLVNIHKNYWKMAIEKLVDFRIKKWWFAVANCLPEASLDQRRLPDMFGGQISVIFRRSNMVKSEAPKKVAITYLQ